MGNYFIDHCKDPVIFHNQDDSWISYPAGFFFVAQVGYRIPKGPGWYFSDKKSDALPPEVSGAPPGERLAWHRAIPTDIDPWSRPFSY